MYNHNRFLAGGGDHSGSSPDDETADEESPSNNKERGANSRRTNNNPAVLAHDQQYQQLLATQQLIYRTQAQVQAQSQARPISTLTDQSLVESAFIHEHHRNQLLARQLMMSAQLQGLPFGINSMLGLHTANQLARSTLLNSEAASLSNPLLRSGIGNFSALSQLHGPPVAVPTVAVPAVAVAVPAVAVPAVASAATTMSPPRGKLVVNKSAHPGEKRGYRDVSTMPDPVVFDRNAIDRKGNLVAKSTEPFPQKLHRMLSELQAQEGGEDIASFLPHGRAFAIHNTKLFEAEVMPTYFRMSRFSSFQRQLNLYDFRRVAEGRDKGAYYHEFFLVGRPALATQMKRTKIKGHGGNWMAQGGGLAQEINFYAMAPVQAATSMKLPTAPSIMMPDDEDDDDGEPKKRRGSSSSRAA